MSSKGTRSRAALIDTVLTEIEELASSTETAQMPVQAQEELAARAEARGFLRPDALSLPTSHRARDLGCRLWRLGASSAELENSGAREIVSRLPSHSIGKYFSGIEPY